EQLDFVKGILKEEEELVHAIASELLAKEELFGDDIDELAPRHGRGPSAYLELTSEVPAAHEEEFNSKEGPPVEAPGTERAAAATSPSARATAAGPLHRDGANGDNGDGDDDSHGSDEPAPAADQPRRDPQEAEEPQPER